MFFSLAASAGDKAETVSIETAGSQMVLYIHPDGEVSFFHYGARFDDPEQVIGYKSYRRWDYGTEPPAYPARGGRHFNQSALAVKYHTGDINTELTYAGHTVSALSDDITRTVLSLRDSKTGIGVDLYYDAYYDEGGDSRKASARSSIPSRLLSEAELGRLPFPYSEDLQALFDWSFRSVDPEDFDVWCNIENMLEKVKQH